MAANFILQSFPIYYTYVVYYNQLGADFQKTVQSRQKSTKSRHERRLLFHKFSSSF